MRSMPPKPPPPDHMPAGKPEIDQARIDVVRRESEEAKAGAPTTARVQRVVERMKEGVAKTDHPAKSSTRAKNRDPRIRRLVLGIDFTEGSTAAASWTRRLLAPEAEVVLVHVVDVPRPPRFLGRRFGTHEEWIQLAREGAEQRLASLRSFLPGEEARVEAREGDTAEELVRLAEEEEADLVVVADHGTDEDGRSLGTTEERVIHLSRVPVFVARGLPVESPKTILAAVDESEAAGQALRWTRYLRRRFGARVVACHALAVPSLFAGRFPVRLDGVEPSAKAIERTRRWLSARLRQAGIPREHTEIIAAVGEPRYEIPSAAERCGADLIIMGSPGAGAIRRGLLSSVTSAVLRRTALPVLFVPEH